MVEIGKSHNHISNLNREISLCTKDFEFISLNIYVHIFVYMRYRLYLKVILSLNNTMHDKMFFFEII